MAAPPVSGFYKERNALENDFDSSPGNGNKVSDREEKVGVM